MPQQSKKQPSNLSFLSYISYGFQLVVTVAVLGIGGNYLDQLLKISFPLFLLLGIIVGLIASIIRLLRQLNNKKN